MAKKETKVTDQIKSLYDMVKNVNAGNGHMALEKIYKDENASAVISVYDEEKPHHMVLEELVAWLEANLDIQMTCDNVLKKIEELQYDLSWMAPSKED